MQWVYRRLKTNSNREETSTNHVGFVYAYVKKAKIEKLTMIKMAQAKKARLIINNEKQDQFQFVSV